jgi:hypothetical protein
LFGSLTWEVDTVAKQEGGGENEKEERNIRS